MCTMSFTVDLSCLFKTLSNRWTYCSMYIMWSVVTWFMWTYFIWRFNIINNRWFYLFIMSTNRRININKWNSSIIVITKIFFTIGSSTIISCRNKSNNFESNNYMSTTITNTKSNKIRWRSLFNWYWFSTIKIYTC
jgi:hypothetical protein